MTSSTLSVLPAAPTAPLAPVANTTGPAAAQAPKDEGFAQHLQTQQQQVQHKGVHNSQTAQQNTPTTQAQTNKHEQAELLSEQAQQVDLEQLASDPALLIATEQDPDEALATQADSGLPAMALSILSQVQAIKNGKAAPKAAPEDTKLNLTSTTARQSLPPELVSASRQPQTGPLSATKPEAEFDLATEVALSKATDNRNPLAAIPARKPSLNAALTLNPSAAQAAWASSASSQARLMDEAAASLAAFGRQIAEDARAGVDLRIASLEVPQLAPVAAATAMPTMPGSLSPLPSPINLTVPTPVQSPEWGAALGRQFITLAQQAQGGIQSADIRLDPPELGPLRITLQMQDGMTHAMITSPHAQVRHAIEQSLQQLQQQFADNGLTLGQTDVGDQHASHQQFQEQLAARHSDDGKPAFNMAGHTSEALGTVTTPAVTRSLASNALVDTFA